MMTDEQKQTTLNGFEETQEGWTAKPVVGGTPLHGESCLKSHVLPALRKHPERVCSLVARGALASIAPSHFFRSSVEHDWDAVGQGIRAELPEHTERENDKLLQPKYEALGEKDLARLATANLLIWRRARDSMLQPQAMDPERNLSPFSVVQYYGKSVSSGGE
ncbi:hypothetical protein CDAR_66891 [Caerostris darwini]|uniref:Uncharacterized protein n=1 Tax=Caerostris darwini TaxID=1538125 RepID=A0AAV4QWQ0_9ARAC|nr:hypothetical protein CDAR_66891 [Caerostris darwini]